jgi:hypothetical protein
MEDVEGFGLFSLKFIFGKRGKLARQEERRKEDKTEQNSNSSANSLRNKESSQTRGV